MRKLTVSEVHSMPRGVWRVARSVQCGLFALAALLLAPAAGATGTLPPEITCPAPVTISCNESTDPSNTGNPTVVHGCPEVSEPTFSDSPADICPEAITRTWTVTDDCGLSDSCTQVITVVDDTPPVIVCPPDVTVGCGEPTDPGATGSATTSDSCNDPPALVWSDQPSGGCGDTIVRAWSSTDACGNQATCIQLVNVLPATGACCVGADCVDDLTQADCEAYSGAYQGDQTVCEGAFLGGYTVQECFNPFEDISGTGTQLLLPDDGGEVVPMGFTFNFYGNDRTNVGVSSNGYLTFGNDLSDLSEDAIPNTNDPNDLIAMLWDDLDPGNSGSPATVHYETLGVPGTQSLVVQFTDVPEFPNEGANSFQAVAYEGTNCIELRYLAITTNDFVAGVENQDGSDGTAVDPGLVVPGSCVQLCPDMSPPIVCEVPAISVPVDIKPGSCPNAYNRNSRGVLPVAIVGGGGVYADDIDVASVEICSLDPNGLVRQDCGDDGMQACCIGPHEGPPGPQTVIEDVATPFPGEACDCHELAGDGMLDVSMKFKTEDLVPALGLDEFSNGDLVELVVTGTLLDGTPFVGSDCVRLVPPGTPPNMLQVWPNAAGAWVDVGPLDDQLDGGGFGVFQRTYPQDTEAVLTAEPEINRRAFLGWRADGGRLLQTDSVTVRVNGHIQTIEAVYEDPPRRCGLGWELGLLVPPLVWLRARRRRTRV